MTDNNDDGLHRTEARLSELAQTLALLFMSIHERTPRDVVELGLWVEALGRKVTTLPQLPRVTPDA